jgi:branched-chain amino acid transport system substrate-binding protein
MTIYRYDREKGCFTRRDLMKGGLAVAAVAATGPYYLRYARAQDGPIRIGFPVPLSGPYSTEAQEQARCAQIAIDQFNEEGGLNGRMAELLVRDDKLDPGEAATRTLELIESDRVNFICGSLSASVQLSVNQVASQRGVIYNSISQSDTINEESDFTRFTFHEALNPHMTSGACARYAFPKYGTRVAFLTADYAFGWEMVRGFERAGEEFGIEKVEEIRHPIGQADYSAFIPRIQAARPEVLVISNFGRDQLNSLAQAGDFGLKEQMKIICPVLLFNQRQAGGEDAYAEVIGGANYYWGIEDEHESARRLNEAYHDAHGTYPSDYAAYGYAGVYGLLEGVKRAESTEADDVIAAMEEMEYDAYKGRQYFRECDHQSVQSVLVLESKPDAEAEHAADVFNVVYVEEGDEARLRTCEELGHA